MAAGDTRRHQATATAVSSGDDLTDFQSQPRPGQRLVSVQLVSELGSFWVVWAVRSCGLWLQLLLPFAPFRCFGHFAADIYIFIYFHFIFIFTLSYMFACPVCLSLCLFAASTFASRGNGNGHGNCKLYTVHCTLSTVNYKTASWMKRVEFTVRYGALHPQCISLRS